MKGFKIALIIGVFVLAVILFLLSPYFYINEINVHGSETIAENEILSRAGIESGTNIFVYNTKEARKRIMENLYIDSVVFDLYIDENGRVIEINSTYTEPLPVVVGLRFDRFRLGDILEVEDTFAFRSVVRYARLLYQYQLMDRISRIDVSDSSNTRVFFHQIEFNVGDDWEADEKVRSMEEIINNLPNAELIRGFVDLREIRAQYVLKIYS
jgi:hypothetical protein